MSMILDVPARFMQPGGPIQLSHEVERTGGSELLYALLFDSQRRRRMPPMESFPSCVVIVISISLAVKCCFI